MSVDIRSLSSLKKTNYKKYSKYFNQVSQTTLTGKGPETEPDFFKESFESAVKQLENLLQEASDELEESNKEILYYKFYFKRLKLI
ncbi:hypothetical protein METBISCDRAFT_26297 [Metschnikowia bicuspidata]|uniref:Uncharacterized protein n=1 Tax=Metschnikowia bicuspidata TaxID=27322 RepID=A0A4P9ZIF7_9ASCO|nr:hypothetical protein METBISCDRAFT_26297 [Metschnikowia bicuspidata]